MKVRFRKKPNKPNKNEVYLRDVWYLYIDGKRDDMTHINVTITIGSDIEICIKP